MHTGQHMWSLGAQPAGNSSLILPSTGYEFGGDPPVMPVTADAKLDYGAKGDNKTDDTEVR